MSSNNINTKWPAFLKKVVDEGLLREKVFEKPLPAEIFVEKGNTPVELYEHHQMLKGSLKNLNPNTSESFLTYSVQLELKKILDSKSFFNKTLEEQKVIQEQLDMLNLDEYEWKRRVTGHNSAHGVILELFKLSFSNFEPMFYKFFSPKKQDLKETQRAFMRFFPHKLESFIEGMLDILISVHGLKTLQKVRDKLSSEDFPHIIKRYITPNSVFVDLVRVIMKNVHDNVFKSDDFRSSDVLTETTFVANKTDIFYEFRKVFALNVVTSVLCYYNEVYGNNLHNKAEDIDITLVTEKIRYFIYRLSHIYDRDTYLWWINDFTSSVNVILEFLEQSDFLKSIAKEKEPKNLGKTKKIVYVLRTKETNLYITITGLPRVVPNENILPGNIENDLKPSLFGENRVTKSESLAEILNIAQAKQFGINNEFLEVLSALMNPTEGSVMEDISKEKTISNPFKTREVLLLIEKQIKDANSFSSLNCFNRVITEHIHTKLVGKGVNNVRYSHLLTIAGISPLEQKLSKEVDIARYRLQALSNQRRLANTHIVIGKLFAGMPIYITNTFCVRLRLYPKQPFISRTSGVFKHILCEFSPIKITLKGMVSLMKCYFIAAGQFEEKFENFCGKTIISKKTGMKVLKDFFTENPINFKILGENFIYTSLLHMEIIRVHETGRTKVMVEIDQKASGSVFLSLALRNRKLAAYSNVISKDKKCPYTYCMERFPEFYLNHMEKRDEQAFNFLSSNRKLHKYAKMCYTYSQKGMGRKEDFIERWYIEEGTLTKDARNVLVEFAYKYDRFIEFVFPGISKQIKNILKLVEFVVKETGETCINNLNGEKLHWRRYQHKSDTKKSYNPVTKQLTSYRIRTIETKEGKLIIDSGDHTKKFLSYLIHSIDAAVMHYFILRIKKKYGYTINHLHDCVLLHPNHVKDFYEIVHELYSTKKLYNIIQTSVFDPAKNAVSTKGAKKIEKIQKKFYDNSDDFEDELINHLPENIYRPES